MVICQMTFQFYSNSDDVKNKTKMKRIVILFLLQLLSKIISGNYVKKSSRLFSNPFGLLGHEACPTSIDDRNVTGMCYNEMECLLK